MSLQSLHGTFPEDSRLLQLTTPRGRHRLIEECVRRMRTFLFVRAMTLVASQSGNGASALPTGVVNGCAAAKNTDGTKT
jgi:hypothetical protein